MKTCRRLHQNASLRWSTCLIVLLLAFAVSARAQESPAQPGTSPPLGIAHVAVRVGNLDASRAFYQKLGFEEAFAFDQGGDPTEAFFKVNDTQFIELYPQRRPGETAGFLHVCFLSQDLDALNKFYRARGLSPGAAVRGGAGNLLFTMNGPGLENIEFTQYMPGSRHTNDTGKHLGKKRIGTRIVGVEFPSNDSRGAASFFASELAFPRETGDESRFHVPGNSREQIGILPGADHVRLTLETSNLKKATKALKKLGIPTTREQAALVIHDPGDNAIVVEAAPKTAPGAKR